MAQGEDYRRGYLAGMIRGDGMILRKRYPRSNGGSYVAHRFRLALVDLEALDRAQSYLGRFGVETTRFEFSPATQTRRQVTAIRTSRSMHLDVITDLIEWPGAPSSEWHAGYLGGIFDAEGSCSQGVLRISNSNLEILEHIEAALDLFDIPFVREPANAIGVANVRVRGGLSARNAFFAVSQPAITRKLALAGSTVKTNADLRVVSIEALGETIEMLDITTTTGDFIANGVVSHNCFARPTHEYLDLDAGEDFNRQIIVKVNVGEVLRHEVAKPSWRREPVALGTNTDPYQRAEGRYALMPDIIAALTESGTPFSILTKGTLLRRDLPLLAAASEHVPVDLAMSIAIYDHELQQSVEPGTPSAKARLATTAVREAYFEPMNWHRTALHELGHWSGHSLPPRTRPVGQFRVFPAVCQGGVGRRNRDSAFVCASLGIVPTVRHADYIGNWLELLRENNRAVLRAASAASKSADFLLTSGPPSSTPSKLPTLPISFTRRSDDQRGLVANTGARLAHSVMAVLNSQSRHGLTDCGPRNP